MSFKPLLSELLPELDLPLELAEDLTVFLPAGALGLSGLRPGEPLVVDIHPLSLRLDQPPAGEPRLPAGLPLAHLDPDGRIRLPFAPPRLTSRHILFQLRRRCALREIHLLAAPR